MTNDTSPKKHTDLSTLIQTALKHHQNGDLLSAEKIYRHILLMDANQLDANHLYGVLICQAGKFGAAIPFLEKAVQIKPDFAEAYNNLGFAYQNLGKLEEALACFKKAIELLPKYPDALNNYGMVLIKLGRLHEAISYHQKAIELKPDFIQAYCNLGALFNKLNQPKTAIDYLDKALNLNSNYADAYYNIAFAWLKMGSTEKCVKALRQTIKLIPNNPFYHNELATVLRESGRIDDAAESYRNALKIDPNYIQAHKNLALIVKHNVYNEEIQKMEKMYFSPSLSQDDKIHLGVGLSKVYEDLELFEKSFQFIVEANNIKRKTYNYSIQKEKLFFKRIINSFNSKFFNRSEIKGRPDKSPVFIVGMPRSGTTLVEQIIASHKSVHGAGELPYFSSLTQSLFRKLNSAQIQDGLNDLSTTDFYSIGTKYIEQTKLFSNDALYITDKLPHNFLQIGIFMGINKMSFINR